MTSVFDMNQGTRFCQVCGEPHKGTQLCGHQALVRRVTKLLEANRLIPQLMEANKEAVLTAANFQLLLRQADKAQEFIQIVLANHGDIGATIYREYLEMMNEWVAQPTKPDTDDRQLLLGNESTTPNDSESKPCTEETPIGDLTVLDSSPLTQNATLAEPRPQS